MEYSQDRLNNRIIELEAEVRYQQDIINMYKDMEKDRTATEAAIFIVGLLVGVAAGFYAT